MGTSPSGGIVYIGPVDDFHSVQSVEGFKKCPKSVNEQLVLRTEEERANDVLLNGSPPLVSNQSYIT